jgi:hypothetical protein
MFGQHGKVRIKRGAWYSSWPGFLALHENATHGTEVAPYQHPRNPSFGIFSMNNFLFQKEDLVRLDIEGYMVHKLDPKL